MRIEEFASVPVSSEYKKEEMGKAEFERCRALAKATELLRSSIDTLRTSAMHLERDIELGVGDEKGLESLLGVTKGKIELLSGRLAVMCEQYERLCRGVELATEGVIEEHRNVLRLRYQQGLRWQDVARRAGYSESHCLRINRDEMRHCCC